MPASVVLGLGWGWFFAAGGLEMWSFISLAVSGLTSCTFQPWAEHQILSGTSNLKEEVARGQIVRFILYHRAPSEEVWAGGLPCSLCPEPQLHRSNKSS